MINMEILDTYEESKTTTQHIVTEVKADNGEEYTIASYAYNGELSEDETAPAFWCCTLFESELSKEERKNIIKKVNEKVEEYLS